MEISPRRSLSLDFDSSIALPAASSYPPTYINCRSNIYPTQGLNSAMDSKSAKPFAMTSSLSMDSGAKTMLVPKKENFISNIFNVLTNAVIERFSKVPSSFINNLNSTLSVTVVPNEGIISQDFFKSLTRSCEQLASEHKNENDSETLKLSPKSPTKLIHESKSQLSYVFVNNAEMDKLPTKVSLDCPEIKKSCDKITKYQLNDKLTFDEMEKKNNDIIRHTEDSTMEDFNAEIVSSHVPESPSIFHENNHTRIDPTCSKSEKSEITVGKTIFEGNCAVGWQNMWQRVVNGMSDHLKQRNVSPDSELSTKKPNLTVNLHTKPRRKTCGVARGRGKGRGKSQLRRSGVSQSRHRKERTKQDIYSNIHDDLETWEISDNHDSGNEDVLQGIRDNEDEKLSPCQEAWKHCSTLFENFNFDDMKKSRKLKQRNGNVKCPVRVRYVSESSIELGSRDSHDCISKIGGFRPRLVSESSVDSEDSYCIVFESSSESEYADYDWNSDSDEESDDDLENEDCDDDETKLRVRFNLEPQVHTMIKWDYAYRAARKGPWEEMARDRERFRGRIRCIERIIEPILTAQHRKCVWQDRFDVDG